MKRLAIALLLVTVLSFVSIVPTPALATGPACPPDGITCLYPGDSVKIYVKGGETIERYAYNPGNLTIRTIHWDYKNPVFDIWAPDKIWLIRAKEAGWIDDKVPWTGESSVCADFEGCTTEWVGGGKPAIGWWLLRIYNPTSSPIAMQFDISGEWLCTAFCGNN